MIDLKIIVFDIETYHNCFLFCGYVEDLNSTFVFEISDRKNQKQELLGFLNHARSEGYYFVGFNNVGFDYPIIHALMMQPYTFTYQVASSMCQQIIGGDKSLTIWSTKDRFIPQIDLYKINHFDNKARATSLKALQFAMRSESVEDLPFPFGPLNDEQKDVLIQYNIHDVMETYKFYLKCKHLIELRKDILDKKMIYGDVLNMSDVKIGYEYLVKELGRDNCYNGGQPKQTQVYNVHLKDIILPKIAFREDDFDAVREHFTTLTWRKDAENHLSFNKRIRGFDYYFGSGGIHGSVESKYYEANDDYEIIDLDVTSLYPSIGIVNNFYPMHLGQSFVHKYAGLKAKRLEHKKGTALNAMFKLALNGAYGKSNDPWSAMYDPSYMLKITINGQLQLLQLAEFMSNVPGNEIIQINTDGITCYVPKAHKEWLMMYRTAWEAMTGLELEEANYKKLWIRDVNNYHGIYTNGKTKSKGAYWNPETDNDYDGNWHKDFSAMIVQKAIKIVLEDGINPEVVVRLATDPFDFMLRKKTPSGSTIFIGDKECSKTVRYYVSTKGHPMVKKSKSKGTSGDFKRKNGITDATYTRILSEIPKGTWDERIHTKNKSTYTVEIENQIEAGKLVKQCNDWKDFDFSDVDYDYYITEITKLCI
jgi:hypothetical protein